MMDNLPSEQLHELEQQVPHLRSSEPLMYLAQKKLLPQQHGIDSFEDPSFLTGMRRRIFGHTKKEQQLIKRQQEELIPFQQEQQIKTKLKAVQEFQMANAPTYEEAGRVLPGLQQLAPRSDGTLLASEAIPTIGGFRDDQLLPGTLNPYDMERRYTVGFTPGDVGTPIVERAAHPNVHQPIPIQGDPDVRARLSPTHMQIFEQLSGQPSTIDESTGALIPLALAKPRTNLMNPDDIIAGSQFREGLGLAPEGTTKALMNAPPSRPLPATLVGQALDDVTKKFVEIAKEKTNKQEFKELEDPKTGFKSVYLVDKATGAIVKEVGKAPRSVNDLLGLDRTREILVENKLDPYETAIRATQGDQQAAAAVAKARQIAKAEEVEIKSAGERAQIEARPLDPKDREAIGLMEEFKRHITSIKSIPKAKLEKYVGYFSLPAYEWAQIARKDPTFAQLSADLGFLQREFFSDETAGAALTALEFNTLRKSIPVGNEWGGLTDFMTKLKEAEGRANQLIGSRTKMATETRGQTRERLTGGKSDNKDIDRKLDALLEELRKKR
jgi:hypothetical protein